jgi:hypothetical protein
MARPFILPDDDRELEDLIRKHGQAEVARMFGVTRAAVSAAVRSRKLNIPTRASFKEYIPWTITTPEHTHWAHPVRMLRIYGKLQQGLPVPPSDERRAKEFFDWLREDDLVIDYDPSNPDDPWIYVPREEGDEHFVRRPKNGAEV